MIPLAAGNLRARQTAIFLTEAVLILGAFLLASALHLDADLQRVFDYGAVHKGLFVTFILMVCFYYNGLYDLSVVKKEPIEAVIRFLRSFGTAALILAIVYFFVPALIIGRGIILTFLIVQLAVLTIFRVGIFRWFITSPKFANRILIVGTGEVARKIARVIQDHAEQGYRLLGYASSTPAEVGSKHDDVPVSCGDDDILRYCREESVDLVVVALSDQRSRLPLWQLLDCKMSGVLVEEVTSFYEKITGRIMVEDIKPSSIIFSEGYRASSLMLISKRLSDIVFSLLGLFAAAPVMLVAALAIRLNSRGPIFYRQERVGQHGKPFLLVKFRTMPVDAEKTTGPVWAKEKDPRLDRLGRLLRLTRIDEIPQMWNVLRGDMSFIGPRPERQFFVRQLQAEIPFYVQRLSVKPGITGWAQTRFHYTSTKEQTLIKLQYDLFYIKNMSFILDMIILADTVKVVLLGEGR